MIWRPLKARHEPMYKSSIGGSEYRSGLSFNIPEYLCSDQSFFSSLLMAVAGWQRSSNSWAACSTEAICIAKVCKCRMRRYEKKKWEFPQKTMWHAGNCCVGRILWDVDLVRSFKRVQCWSEKLNFYCAVAIRWTGCTTRVRLTEL